MKDTIVVPAWALASGSATIKKFNYLPSLFATIYLSMIILYQVAWSYVYLFELKDEFFSLVIDFAHASYFEETLGILTIFFLIYLFITPIAEGGLVHLISKRDAREPYTKPYLEGFGVGLRNFLPIFEAHNLLAPFKLLSIITFYLFALRIFGKDYALSISMIIAVYMGFSFFLNILFAYTRFFIVIEGKKAFEAMGLSVGMTLENLDVTFRLYFTLILVYVRTIFTIAFLISLPFLASFIVTYVSIGFVKVGALILTGVVVLGFLAFISHVNSVLEIFVEALWYRAFKDNRSRLKTENTSHHEISNSDHHSSHH